MIEKWRSGDQAGGIIDGPKEREERKRYKYYSGIVLKGSHLETASREEE